MGEQEKNTDIIKLLWELNESLANPSGWHKKNCSLQGSYSDSPCWSLTGGVALGQSGHLIFLLCKVRSIGSWHILVFRTTQKDRNLGSYLCFQTRRLRLRGVTALSKRVQLINGEVGSKQGLLSLAPMQCSWRCLGSPTSMIPCLLTYAIFTLGHSFLEGWHWCLRLRMLASFQNDLSRENQSREHSDLETEPTVPCLPFTSPHSPGRFWI